MEDEDCTKREKEKLFWSLPVAKVKGRLSYIDEEDEIDWLNNKKINDAVF